MHCRLIQMRVVGQECFLTYRIRGSIRSRRSRSLSTRFSRARHLAKPGDETNEEKMQELKFVTHPKVTWLLLFDAVTGTFRRAQRLVN
jgi:hypothetical protein